MKTFLLIFIFALSLKAESSYQSKCVNSFYLTSSGTTHRINVVYSHTPSTVNALTYSYQIIDELVNNDNKFKYDSVTNRCNLVLRNNTLGMTNEQYAFLSSLIGVLVGFVILFFSIFLTIKVGSKNA